MSSNWNPWHGCHKKSEGCAHCYVYRIDERHGRNSAEIWKTKGFDLPIRKSRNGDYKIRPGSLVYTCFSSDFLVEEADEWRKEAWRMMRQRDDLVFLFITKRIERLAQSVPPDWGKGYDNVMICCTAENQLRVRERIPIFLEAPIRTKMIVCEPLLEEIDLSGYLGPWIDRVVAGGESGSEARPCHYEWIQSLRRQCDEKGVGFYFKQTGANFVRDGVRYRVPRKEQHAQARKAGINTATMHP